MRTSTAHNHLQRLSGILVSIYSSARWGASSHADILERMRAKVWHDPALRSTPSWVRMLLVERSGVALSDLYRANPDSGPPSLVWTLFLDGQPIAFNDVPSERMQDLRGAHTWSHRPGRCFAPAERTMGGTRALA